MVRLDCAVIMDNPNEETIALCRGATKVFTLTRDMISVHVQKKLLKSFSFTESEYLAAIYCIN